MKTGIALHSGEAVSIEISPAKPGLGIVFFHKGETIKASVENITATNRSTSLKEIGTVEHLLAALYGMGIYDAEIKVIGNEIPIEDGSALPFVEEIKKNFNLESNHLASRNLRKPIKLDKIEARPYDGFKIHFMIEFPIIGKQEFSLEITPQSFEKEIAPARTFGFLSELEELKKRGLARGASLENALAIDEKGYVNRPRFPNEPVRHKILDLIGDLALLGAPLKAEIFANKSGHKDNVELVRRILCRE